MSRCRVPRPIACTVAGAMCLGRTCSSDVSTFAVGVAAALLTSTALTTTHRLARTLAQLREKLLVEE